MPASRWRKACLVSAPRVAESPASLECKVVEVVEIRTLSGAWSGSVLTIGEVIAVHIDEAYVRDGRFDTAGAHPLARCAYQDYAAVESVFSLAARKAPATCDRRRPRGQ